VPGLLSFAIIEGPSWGWSSPWVVAGFAGARCCCPCSFSARRPPPARLAARIGHRPVLAAGAVSWAAVAVGLALLIGGSPDWAARWRPVSLLVGLGIALTLPVQSGAAVATLPPARFALGSAVFSSFRQVEALLGISVSILEATLR
jgi:hypothetical protein